MTGSVVGRRLVGVLGEMGIHPTQRLSGIGRRGLAYLAIKGPIVNRMLMSADLWPDLVETRARANLRRVLWQLPREWVSATGWDLRLNAEVDLQAAKTVAENALSGALLDGSELNLLSNDLLPGWYDEWLVSEQEQFHLRRIQALEEASRTATRQGIFGLAARAGLSAVCAEPLRESAVTALIHAHLGEGNRFEAVRRYRSYTALLQRELSVEPGDCLTELIAPFLNGGRNGSG